MRKATFWRHSPDRNEPITYDIGTMTRPIADRCRRLMRSDWFYATGEKSYFKVNSLTSAKLDSTFFQIFFSRLGLSP
jgi:hypothetical protein